MPSLYLSVLDTTTSFSALGEGARAFGGGVAKALEAGLLHCNPVLVGAGGAGGWGGGDGIRFRGDGSSGGDRDADEAGGDAAGVGLDSQPSHCSNG